MSLCLVEFFCTAVSLCVYVCGCMYVCTYICVRMCTCVCVCASVCMSVCMYMNVRVLAYLLERQFSLPRRVDDLRTTSTQD